MARISLSILAVGVMLAGCNDANEQRVNNTANSVDAFAERTEDRIENAADNAMMAVRPAPSAQDFVNRAAKSDAFEIAAARLAATNAASAEVKAFAAQMITAHTESTAKIKAAAGKASPSIVPDAALTREQTKDLEELRAKTGAAFDDEYMDGQVEAHEDALALMRSYATGGKDAALKGAAGEIAQVVEGHLKMARELEAKTDL